MRSPYEFGDHYPTGEEWRESALCRQVSPELFFPEKGESSQDAKRICGMCAVRQECLDYAMRAGEKFGVFGGVSERGRRKLRRRAA